MFLIAGGRRLQDAPPGWCRSWRCTRWMSSKHGCRVSNLRSSCAGRSGVYTCQGSARFACTSPERRRSLVAWACGNAQGFGTSEPLDDDWSHVKCKTDICTTQSWPTAAHQCPTQSSSTINMLASFTCSARRRAGDAAAISGGHGRGGQHRAPRGLALPVRGPLPGAAGRRWGILGPGKRQNKVLWEGSAKQHPVLLVPQVRGMQACLSVFPTTLRAAVAVSCVPSCCLDPKCGPSAERPS